MDKKYLALGILIVCTISLFVGLFSPKKQTEYLNLKSETNLLQNIDIPTNKIALLNIEGAISADMEVNSWTNSFSVNNFLASLEKANKDNTVKAIIIRINSPGGTVAASQDIYDALMRTRKHKPIVVSMADVAASGGYYIASAADRIVAQKGTMTGSIGVIFNFLEAKELADKIGISSNVIKSGSFKDSGSMYRKMTAGEEDLFRNSVMQAYEQFITAIEDGRIKRKDVYLGERRNLTIEILKKYADGRVFLGEEAYQLGFIDMLGSQYDAQLLASAMAGYKTILPIVPYNKMNGLASILMNFENKFFSPLKNLLPFSYKHSSQPLAIWE